MSEIVTVKLVVEGGGQADDQIGKVNAGLEQTADSAEKAAKEARDLDSSIEGVASNGGAIAILDRLTGGLATQLKEAFEASKLFNGSLRATRGALIATGIGALVVALGVVVAYWDDIVDFITGANRALERQKRLLEDQSDILEAQTSLIDSEKALAKARGESIDELLRKEDQLLKSRIENLQAQLVIAQAAQQEASEAVQTLSLLEKIRVGLSTATQGGSESLFGALGISGINESDKQELDDTTLAVLQLQQALNTLLLAREEVKVEQKAETRANEDVGNIADLIKKDPRVQIEEGVALDVLAIRKAVQDETDKRNAEAAKNQIIREKELQKQRLAIAASTLGSLATIAGEATTAGKAFGVAQALINTYVGITEALKVPFPASIAAVAAVAATGFSSVRRILQTNVSGFGQGAIASDSGVITPLNSAASQAPDFNIIGTGGSSQIVDAINAQSGQAVRAYVVSKDVTSQQELDRNVQGQSRLGG